jgi:hypothetical protein
MHRGLILMLEAGRLASGDRVEHGIRDALACGELGVGIPFVWSTPMSGYDTNREFA